MSIVTLIDQARRGDRVAMGRLLMFYDLRLRRRIDRRITPDLQAALSADDILQEAYAQAYQHVKDFQPRGEDSFYAWLATIADRKLIDAVKALRAAKRPPLRQARRPAADRSGSFMALAELLGDKGSTPSRVVARQEAAHALQVAMASLPEPCRQAVWMRHIEGKSVRETAAALGRTERAVHQLCYRGLARLRKEMGSRSRYLSDSF